MSKRLIFLFAGILMIVLMVVLFVALLFLPKQNVEDYQLQIKKGQGISAVSYQLAQDERIFSRYVLAATAYVLGMHNQLTQGGYRFPARISSWEILQRLRDGRPDGVRVRIVEGMTFAKMRQIINQTDNIQHDSEKMSDAELLKAVAPSGTLSPNPEGLFYPDSYEIASGSSDMQIFQAAFRAMERELQAAWENRAQNLPYQNKYELLIMASLVEKETAHSEDREHVAAVFRNRLTKKMRLQTDPTVIYGMGEAYQGKIKKADLQRDTPYNTYTRFGLPPTPIALPSRASLKAAANPADSDYLYFVSRMDNTGRSQFSRTLDEHNAAVRKYILNK